MSRYSQQYSTPSSTSAATPNTAQSNPDNDRGSTSGSDDGFNQKVERDQDDDNSLTSQTLNADGTPKRPMNAFMIFARRRRPQVSSENQSMRTGEISKILSKEWTSMLASEKQFYLDQAKQLKETFNSKYPDYVYRRRPNNSRRSRRSKPVDLPSSNPGGISGLHGVDGDNVGLGGGDLGESSPSVNGNDSYLRGLPSIDTSHHMSYSDPYSRHPTAHHGGHSGHLPFDSRISPPHTLPSPHSSQSLHAPYSNHLGQHQNTSQSGSQSLFGANHHGLPLPLPHPHSQHDQWNRLDRSSSRGGPGSWSPPNNTSSSHGGPGGDSTTSNSSHSQSGSSGSNYPFPTLNSPFIPGPGGPGPAGSGTSSSPPPGRPGTASGGSGGGGSYEGRYAASPALGSSDSQRTALPSVHSLTGGYHGAGGSGSGGNGSGYGSMGGLGPIGSLGGIGSLSGIGGNGSSGNSGSSGPGGPGNRDLGDFNNRGW
ncbi:hypothetical protein D9758_012764 [Tetrapyrgos nigripes]|uniref:HMG box domain-containing protein n=1 Tax=Tetrapyrgos nigripes TaxID=182062 RepID=A0A8H5CR10_9AGAR|nr:hypothetical protein D9758_012764 [Tetrapyrgos nigripes]